jgi:hypothetical protein
MKEFILLFNNNNEPGHMLSTNDVELMQKNWKKWMETMASSGNLSHPGNRLGKEGKKIKPGKLIVDGPFTESKEIVGGYTIIKAHDLDEAAQIATGCPILEFGGSVDVINVVAMDI